MKHLEIRKLPELSFVTSEALNQFRVNLSFCGSDIKTVMLTSSTPNEGKSFVSTQLWKMMADIGVRTLLIDCDLRNSEMRSKLGITSQDTLQGTIHYLAGKADLDDVIYKTNINNGYIMPALGSSVNPTMLLESDRFVTMMEEVKNVFDFVIVDTPPLGSVADAQNIAKYVDGTVLIVHSGQTPKKMVRNALRLLERTKTPFLGIVLNRIDLSSKSSNYYNKYYSNDYYYKK